MTAAQAHISLTALWDNAKLAVAATLPASVTATLCSKDTKPSNVHLLNS
jgi:hypothetical protein